MPSDIKAIRPHNTHPMDKSINCPANQGIRSKVTALLGWSDLHYGEFQLEMGEEYLVRKLLGQDEHGYRQLIACRMFWQWWINQWNFRDEGFAEYAARIPHHQRVIQYRKLHSPYHLRVRPHRIVLERIDKELKTNSHA